MKTLNIGSGKYKDNNGEWSTLPCLKGDKGNTGESAYQLAVRLGTFTGTEEEYNKQFSEIVRKTNAAEKSIKEAENKIQENIKNIDSLNKDLKTKINIPLENPEIGKILKIKSINEDGTFVCEWAAYDVQINGQTIVQNGIAEIPIAQKYNQYGLFCILNNYNLLGFSSENKLPLIKIATKSNISNRNSINSEGVGGVIDSYNFDKAVKAAMCDGKGAAWTADEQAAARERMGIDEWEDVITYTTSDEEENSTICYIDFEHTYKKIYVLIDESAIKGTTYMSTRFGVIGKNKLHNTALLTNTSPAFNIKQKYKTFSAEIMNTADISYRYTASSSVQLHSYCENPFIGRVGQPSITAVDASAIGGITWYGKMYAGTRIVVKGVRA